VDLAWPPDEPRIRLDRILELEPAHQGAGSRWVAWLTESEQPANHRLFQRPYSVAWDEGGWYVTDPDSGIVARIDSDGGVTASQTDLFDQPLGIARCDDGVVVSDPQAGTLALLDSNLQLVDWLARELARPTGVTCANGEVFVAETAAHRILVLDREGNRREIGSRGSEPGQFNYPTAIAWDSGDLLVGDSMNFRVQRIDAETGRAIQTFGQLGDRPGDMPRVKGLAVDSEGNLWVSDAHLDRVSLFDREGRFLMALGRPGGNPGEFSFPAGIVTRANGIVAVVDSLNRRLQIFRMLATDAKRGSAGSSGS